MEKQNDWRTKFHDIFQTCSEELKRTTEIGKKMLSASKTNTNLHEAYEELGVLAAKAIKNKELTWENEKVAKLLKTIEGCENDLKDIENQVNDIRFAEGSEDSESKTNNQN